MGNRPYKDRGREGLMQLQNEAGPGWRTTHGSQCEARKDSFLTPSAATQSFQNLDIRFVAARTGENRCMLLQKYYCFLKNFWSHHLSFHSESYVQ